MGGGGEKMPGQYMGWWGSLGSPAQKGVVTYAVSPNRQRPLAGTLNAAIFNTFRRTRQQILYWAPPMILAYSAMNWAIERWVIPLFATND
ncbi:ubiquinol-cytochrome c reductase subunit 8 [Coniosporium apollinis CBS 100218]|uniref:Cytochrome b-c1 complex subunit 8 n=1 Tax=Coniosporium apollinis (strain CBS 100218) TaxID=1168221 RepID=R7Z634_CONA1|nr:ubiquinol-cytochrome c reductase subunit 8 [Coniosporium apollinis CBS 100218]EON69568.1 ubiquinol-cytochrome c reductase subunit 8 [Coniosporium apollinis CBS 100218]